MEKVWRLILAITMGSSMVIAATFGYTIHSADGTAMPIVIRLVLLLAGGFLLACSGFLLACSGYLAKEIEIKLHA